MSERKLPQFLMNRCKELAWAGSFCTIFLLSQSPLHALVIDDIRVLSKLGQPLQAEIRVSAAAGEVLSDGCFSAVRGGGDLPNIGSVRLSLSRNLATPVLSVTTALPVREPMSEFVLRVKCAGSPTLQRSFLVMIDPPGMADLSAPLAPANQTASITLEAAPGPTAKRASARTAPRGEAIPPGSNYVVRSGDMLSTIAARVAGRPDWTVWPIAQQIYAANPGAFLLGNPNMIAEGSTIMIPRLEDIDLSLATPANAQRAASASTSAVPAPSATAAVTASPTSPAPARLAPAPRVVAIAAAQPAWTMTTALFDESRMKLRLRRQGTPVAPAVGATQPAPVQTASQPATPPAATDPAPQTQPERPDAATTASRVALAPQAIASGSGRFSWLWTGLGLLLAFVVGAIGAFLALRHRMREDYDRDLRDAVRIRERELQIMASRTAQVAAPAVVVTESRPPEYEPAPVAAPVVNPGLEFDSPDYTVETSEMPELDLELPDDEPQTLEMPTVSGALDLELPGESTGQSGQHEVDYELLEKAYSAEYEAEYIGAPEEQAPSTAPAASDGEQARYYHLENHDPADDAPLPIELGEDEMTGAEASDKIVRFPKASG